MQRLQATRRFDTHRQEANMVNALSKVCTDLPEDCYDDTFLGQHDELAKLSLRIVSDPSRLDNALAAVAERRTSVDPSPLVS